MKKLSILFIIVLTTINFAQFKDSGFPEATVKDGIVNNNNSGSSLFGIFNSNNFQMNHSYSLSYASFGNQGLALGVYTNSMFFKVMDNMNIQADVSLVHSPYSSLGKNFQNSLNGIYLSKAAFNYKPFKDFQISIQYQRLPNNYYNPYYSPYGYNRFNDFYGADPFFR